MENRLLYLPSREEQKRLAEKLQDLEGDVRTLEESLERKLSLLSVLKQSLLQKAFSGELTADCPKREAGSVAV